MNSGQLPRFLEPRKLANQEACIEGEIAVSRLPRLADYRDDQDEAVRAVLRFSRDQEGRQLLTGTLDTVLASTCQRCLEKVRFPVHANLQLVMVRDEEQIKELPEELDPWLLEDERIILTELIEEELLLALPLVAMHESCPTPLLGKAVTREAEVPETAKRKDNPFAVLASLKNQPE